LGVMTVTKGTEAASVAI